MIWGYPDFFRKPPYRTWQPAEGDCFRRKSRGNRKIFCFTTATGNLFSYTYHIHIYIHICIYIYIYIYINIHIYIYTYGCDRKREIAPFFCLKWTIIITHKIIGFPVLRQLFSPISSGICIADSGYSALHAQSHLAYQISLGK